MILTFEFILGNGSCTGEMPMNFNTSNYEQAAEFFTKTLAAEMVKEAMLNHLKNSTAGTA